MKFKVIDRRTKKEPDLKDIVVHEKWADGITYLSVDGFALTPDGEIILMDSCGNYVSCPKDRFIIQTKVFPSPLEGDNKGP